MKPETTALQHALIRRQDAQAARTARAIRGLLETHVDADNVERAWTWERDRVREPVLLMPGELAPLIVAVHAQGVAAVGDVMRAYSVQLLRDLASDDALPYLPSARHVIRRSRLRPSKTLAAARARSALLQAELMNVRGQIARLR